MMAAEKINLWSRPKIAAADPEHSFQPYLSLFLLPGEEVRGMVLICPGGAYEHRAPHEGDVVARKFNEMGFHAAVVEYRVSPHVFPEPQEDLLRAVKLTRANAAQWHVKPDKIAVLGFSAGGHLACSAGILFDAVKADDGDAADGCSARPDAAILCYPVITGLPAEEAHRYSFDRLLGHPASDDEVRPFSWDLQVRKETPPTFLWHTAADNAVPVSNSLRYALALQKAGIPYEMHIYPYGYHGLGLGTSDDFAEVRSWPKLCRTWLKKMGF